MDAETAEKIARNNAAFRAANDQLESAALKHGLGQDGGPIPFLCECSDRRCVKILLLTLEEYRHIRSEPRWFVHAIDHQEQVEGAVVPVERHSGWVLVEKVAHAGDVAARLETERRRE